MNDVKLWELRKILIFRFVLFFRSFCVFFFYSWIISESTIMGFVFFSLFLSCFSCGVWEKDVFEKNVISLWWNVLICSIFFYFWIENILNWSRIKYGRKKKKFFMLVKTFFNVKKICNEVFKKRKDVFIKLCYI